MREDTYKALAILLDTLPNGFPPTDDGTEIKILKKISSVRLTLKQFQLVIWTSNFFFVISLCQRLINGLFLKKRYAQNL
jgi:hypothetical protein